MLLPDRRELTLRGDWFDVDIILPEETESGLKIIVRDPVNSERKPDCYEGTVREVSLDCIKVKIGDNVVFTRWEYSQWHMAEGRLTVRETDLVVVNGRCVNEHIAVKLHEPFKRNEELILVETRKAPEKNFWGQVIDADLSSKNKDTKDLKEGDIILFQYMSDYQYRVGKHTVVFKDIPDVVIAKMEPELVNA